MPSLKIAETVQEVNAALREIGRKMGAVPEYHAYHVRHWPGEVNPNEKWRALQPTIDPPLQNTGI